MAKKIILFSEPTPDVMSKLTSEIFADFLKEKIVAYMPSDGSNAEANAKYTPFWQEYAQSNGAQFIYLDNSKTGTEAEIEIGKLKTATILMITGGNTFTLLENLRKSGFDQAIKQFWQKNDVVLVGFSAGALVLTPSIETSSDTNTAGLSDLSGLDLVDFEVWPHFNPEQRNEFDEFSKSHPGVMIKPIPNDQFLIINK